VGQSQNTIGFPTDASIVSSFAQLRFVPPYIIVLEQTSV